MFTDQSPVYKTALSLFSWTTSPTTNSSDFLDSFANFATDSFAVFHDSSGLCNSLEINVLKITEYHPEYHPVSHKKFYYNKYFER